MKRYARWLMFLKRAWLLACGLVHFGPRRTYQAQKSLSVTLDAFEALYERLPNQDERIQIVRKLSWFAEHFHRIPTNQEAREIAQQTEIQ
jgi:hypothetical protein